MLTFSGRGVTVNIIGAYCKCHDELQAAYAIEIANMLAIDELETGEGLNQIGIVKQARDTH